MRAEIDALANDDVLNANLSELPRQIAEKYRVASVTLGTPVIADHGQKSVPGRGVVSYVVYAIPFEGDAEILRRRVNWLNKPNPAGELWTQERELRIEVSSAVGGAAQMKDKFESTRKSIAEHVKSAVEQVENHNKYLEPSAQEQIRVRRTKLINHSLLVKELGTPVRPAAPPPATYTVKLPRKEAPRLEPTPVPAGAASAARPAPQPEPALAMEAYNHILKVIQAAGVSMERGPQSFERMNEGELRDQLLMVLNSHYGGVSAETFNKQGQTDILVRHEGHNLFIGECKIWRGAPEVRQAIAQLLRYTTWRDTKTAILFFARRKDVSGILKRILEVFREHKNFVREDRDYPLEGALRFVMRHGSDADRTMLVTVMVFQVAGKARERGTRNAERGACGEGEQRTIERPSSIPDGWGWGLV